MKLMYGNVPVKSLNIHSYELNTNDCDMVASDLQSGKTAVARGQKITGTGKSFEFAYYGAIETNFPIYIPNNINVIEVASMYYPIQLSIAISDMKDIDFTIVQTVCDVVIDGVVYPLTIQASNNILTATCDKDIKLQVFYGKDNYT